MTNAHMSRASHGSRSRPIQRTHADMLQDGFGADAPCTEGAEGHDVLALSHPTLSETPSLVLSEGSIYIYIVYVMQYITFYTHEKHLYCILHNCCSIFCL